MVWHECFACPVWPNFGQLTSRWAQACRGPFAHGSSGFTPPPGNKVTTSASSRESRCSTSQGLLYHRAAVAIQRPETWFGQYAWIFQMDSDRRVNVSDIQNPKGTSRKSPLTEWHQALPVYQIAWAEAECYRSRSGGSQLVNHWHLTSTVQQKGLMTEF